ncbi:reverse transcriptase domain-containing protein [Actinomadura sp. NPDC000600]|uniref:RNA-directed DNA polymerase n=1 Tax=Actinomadura sp. NPDC000600 TaxID=3154262 RepID=UPI00339B3317
MNWLDELDIDRAIANVSRDQLKDWYRDPWGWPENRFIRQGERGYLAARAKAVGARRVANLDVPKENFSFRPAVVMDPVDRILYQALVDRISRSLVGSMPDWVHGWRLKRNNPESGHYAGNNLEWDRQRADLSWLVTLYSHGLKTDIVSCFASMPIIRVCEEIERRAGSEHVPSRLISMLETWDTMPGRYGLPQRSMASSVIANMFLAPLDHRIGIFNDENARPVRKSEKTEKRKAIFASLYPDHLSTRWMDDIWVFGDDAGALRSLQVELQKIARDYGLELNASKTGVYSGDELAELALKINHSAIDNALDGKDPDPTPLEELIDAIVNDPEGIDRPSVRFATVRMRKQNLKAKLPLLQEVAPRIPHAADHLARAFRDFDTWRDLQDWYLDYLDSDWSCFEWSSAQLGTMFPASAKVEARLVERLEDAASARPSLPMMALAMQRLCRWKPSAVKELVRSLHEVADLPHERRLLALAAVAVEDERSLIGELLSEYEENLVTLEMIKSASYRPFRVAGDFDGTPKESPQHE